MNPTLKPPLVSRLERKPTPLLNLAIETAVHEIEISFDLPHSGETVRMYFPADSTAEQRAEIFAHLAKLEHSKDDAVHLSYLSQVQGPLSA